jgi:DNA-binding transcriptional regulator YiaG
VFKLPKTAQNLLAAVTKAERQAERAQERASVMKKRATRRLRRKLGISVREVGALMGVSGARVQQLLRE